MTESCLSLSLVIIISVFIGTQLTAAVPHAKLRFGLGTSTTDSLTFVGGNSMESSEHESGRIFKSSSLLSSYIISSPKSQLNGGPIVFDEDYDEPLRPQPVFQDRNSFPGTTKYLANSTSKPESIIRKLSPKPDNNTEKTTPTVQSITSKFQPIVFPSSTSHPTTNKSPPKAISSTTSSPQECVQTEDNDCDEIIIDGSIYAQLIYRTPEDNQLRIRNRKMHKTDGFFLA